MYEKTMATEGTVVGSILVLLAAIFESKCFDIGNKMACLH
jgi:hypothetical protein